MRDCDNSGEKFDIKKTQIIDNLFSVDKSKRDDKWLQKFKDNIWNASLQLLDKKPFTGHDGFPYLPMALPTAGKSFETYCLSHVAPHCLKLGAGVVIFPTAEKKEPGFVFSFGLIDSILRHESWVGNYSWPHNKKIKSDDEQDKSRTYLKASPSEDFIPDHTKRYIAKIMTKFGLQNPKIGLIVDNGEFLLLNCKKQNFKSDTEMQKLFQTIGWFLTPGIGIMLLPDSWDDKNMMVIE